MIRGTVLSDMTMMGRDNARREVRILLVGDPGVGKTSLIFSLVSEEFSEEVPAKSEEITIPPDVTPDRVTTQIVDTSCQEQSEEELVEELHKANVVCIVYSVEDDETIDRITTYWLPFLRNYLGEDHKTPVVLVGNKSDMVDYSSLDVILPVMNMYSEVETCVECSAKNLKNIAELFFYAQKAVLHPTAPLYSADDRDLTQNCKQALARIFKLCDDNNDGILSDDELNGFQRRCFGSPLQAQALEDVKTVVKTHIPDGIFDDGLTLSGFLFLHTLFIQRGRHETTWTVLRKFGYNDDVQLDEEYLRPSLDVPEGCSVELTKSGYRFLTYLFQKYDSDHDAALNPNELESLFSFCSSLPSWFDQQYLVSTVETNDDSWITLPGFLSMWTLMTHVEPSRTLECLAYLGYNVDNLQNSQMSAVQVTRDKRVDLEKRQTGRNVFSCHLIGPQGAGKSSFMKGFLGMNLSKQGIMKEGIMKEGKKSKTGSHSVIHNQGVRNLLEVDKLPNYSVNSISIYGQEKYLIIREVDVYTLTDRLSQPELLCDVVCLMYDVSNPRSFEYIARIYLKHFYECRLPVLILGAKSDKTVVHQGYSTQPEEFCAKYKLAKPQVFTVNPTDGQVSQDVYLKLGTMAAYPTLRRLVHYLSIPTSASWSTHLNALQRVMPESVSLYSTVGLAAVAIACLLIFKSVQR